MSAFVLKKYMSFNLRYIKFLEIFRDIEFKIEYWSFKKKTISSDLSVDKYVDKFMCRGPFTIKFCKSFSNMTLKLK